LSCKPQKWSKWCFKKVQRKVFRFNQNYCAILVHDTFTPIYTSRASKSLRRLCNNCYIIYCFEMSWKIMPHTLTVAWIKISESIKCWQLGMRIICIPLIAYNLHSFPSVFWWFAHLGLHSSYIITAWRRSMGIWTVYYYVSKNKKTKKVYDCSLQ
jgi:hypothetical protein